MNESLSQEEAASFDLMAMADEEQDQAIGKVKRPPQSIEAEQSVLGGLLLDGEAFDHIADIIVVEDFYRNEHKMIYRQLMELAANDQPMDVVTLHDALEKQGELDKVGGLAYLAELANNVPSASNIKAYASIVQERSTMRQLISVANKIAGSCYEPEGHDAASLLDQAESKVFNIAESRPKTGGPQRVNPLLSKAVEKLDELFTNQGKITGLSTGFADVDEQTAGLQPADLVIVAGRPSMGKTTFAMNIVENATIESGKAVLVFSMEMPADALIMRSLSSLGRIDATKMRTGSLDDDDWPRLTSAMNLLKDKPLFIDDTPALTPIEMRARARRVARESNGIGLIMIDYIQLMQGSTGGENRTAEISEISRSLKGLAKELSCPVVALSQLNRSLEQRPNKRPIMSDLRESGAIEQDADIIMFIYRDEVYNEESPDKGIAEVIIAKQRNGPIGTQRLAFFGRYTKFEDLAPGSYEGYE